MRVVALISGGKDSCYSMQLCKEHGHDIVALANLLPEESAPDELDSFCFQTVGHQLIGAYAACMGIPLFRKHISGTSSVQDLGYSPTEGDEVEDLYQLLAYVKENVPGVQAVASGAIASDYQRLRVENVCSRLNLVSLAYLWHQPQRLLLRGMVESGVEAILVKVACLGLHPRKHLGRSIAAMEPTLLSLADAYGCNVCGEGGEYETLTLDCAVFSRGRIQLDEFEVVVGSADVGHLVPKAFRVLHKAGWEGCELPSDVRFVPGDYVATPSRGGGGGFGRCAAPLTPPLTPPLAPGGGGAGNIIAAAAGGGGGAAAAAACSSSSCGLEALLQPAVPSWFDVQVSVCSGPDYVQLVCRAVRPKSALPSDLTECDTTAALHALLATAEQELAAQHMDLHHCLFVHLFLANMGHFQAANGVYCKHFPGRDPPSRACVQVCLPHDCPVMCELLLARGAAPPVRPLRRPTYSSGWAVGPLPPPPPSPVRHTRRVLHVQSISSWAPSCIGPYSQATSYRGLVYLAGVIPLDPPLMTLVPGDITAQVLRAMLSCEAVAVAQRTTVVGAALGVTVYLAAAVGGGGGQGGGGGMERCGAGGSGGGAELRALTRAAVEALLEHGLPGYPSSQHRSCGPPSTLSGACGPGGGGGGGSRYLRSSTCESTGAVGTPRGSHSSTWPGGYNRASAPGVRRAVLLGADGLDEEEEAERELSGGQAMLGGHSHVCGGGGSPAFGLAVLDSYLQPPEVRAPVRPSVLYVTVPSLPRGSLVEIQPVCLDVEALVVIRKLTGHDSFVRRRNSSHHDAASLHAAANSQQPQPSPNPAPALATGASASAASGQSHAPGSYYPASHSMGGLAAFPSPTGGGGAITSWSELPPTPRASMESLGGRDCGLAGFGGMGGGGSSLNLMHVTHHQHHHHHHHHGSSPVQWSGSADMMAMSMVAGSVGAPPSPLPSHVLSAAGFMSPDAGGSLAGTPAAGPSMLSRQRSSGVVAGLMAANGSSSGGGVVGIHSLSGGVGGMFHRSLSPSPPLLSLPSFTAPAGMVAGAVPAVPPPVSGMVPWAQALAPPPPAAAAVAGEVQLPGLQTPPHPPLSAQSSGRQLMSPTLQHLLQMQLPAQLLSQPLQQATANAPPLQQLQNLHQHQQQQLGRSGTSGGGSLGGRSQRLSGSLGGGAAKEAMAAAAAAALAAPSGGMARNRSSFSGSSGSSSGPLAQRSSLDGNILSFEVSSGRAGPSMSLAAPLPPHGAAAPTVLAAEAPATPACPAASPPGGGGGGRGHAPVVRLRPAAITVPPPSVYGSGSGVGSGGARTEAHQRSPFESAVGAATGAAATGVSSVELPPPAAANLLMASGASAHASRHPPHPPALTIPQPQTSSSGSETTPTPLGHTAAAPALQVAPASGAAIRPGGSAAAAAGSSSSDVMVTTVCCYGQVLRSLFHLPPAVFSPGVTTAQLTRRFRRAAASVLAVHGMDMSCLIWARVWYEKGSVEFKDDEYGTGAAAPLPSGAAAAAGAWPQLGVPVGCFTAPAVCDGPRVLHALDNDVELAAGGGGGGGRRRRSVRRASGSANSSSGSSPAAAAAAAAALTAVGAGGGSSPLSAASRATAAAEVAAGGPAVAVGGGGCGGGGSPRCPGSPADDVASSSPQPRRLSGLQPDVSPSRDDQQSHHRHSNNHHSNNHHSNNHSNNHHHQLHGQNGGGAHSHSFTHHHHQHGAREAAVNGGQPQASAVAQQHFHVSWVPVQRVATNATPQPAQCVAVLELLAALPTP